MFSRILFATFIISGATFPAYVHAANAHAAIPKLASRTIACSDYELKFFMSANWCPACRRVNDQLASYYRSNRAMNSVSQCGYDHEIVLEFDGKLVAVRVNKIDISYLSKEELRKAGMTGRYVPELQLTKGLHDSAKVVDSKTGEFSLPQIKRFLENAAQKNDNADRNSKSVADADRPSKSRLN